jgi:hypothetical protein
VFAKCFYTDSRETYAPLAFGSLRRDEYGTFFGEGQAPFDLKDSRLKVYVLPLKT